MSFNTYDLGATLYVPLNRVNLVKLFSRYQSIKSIIIDCEDSINCDEVLQLDAVVDSQLSGRKDNQILSDKLIFLRVRNPAHLQSVKEKGNHHHFDGFVLPKFSFKTAPAYRIALDKGDLIMPVIETEIFYSDDLNKTFSFVEELQSIIQCVRVGANDILGFFGLRRPKHMIIYEHPVFAKYFTEIYIHTNRLQLPLSGPVCDYFSDESLDLLRREVLFEKDCGIFTKSAIHPRQVQCIQDEYILSEREYKFSHQLMTDVRAITSIDETMLEKITHRKWAEETITRYGVYGFKPE
jgi:citrate lyase beta subunit